MSVPSVRPPSAGKTGAGGSVGRTGKRPLDPFVGEANPPGAGRLVRVREAVLPDNHPRQCERRHLEVVDDGQALEPRALGQLTPEPVFVACGALGREQGIQVLAHLLPRLAVPGEGELRRRALDFEPAAHEDVGAAHLPDDDARLPGLGHQFSVFHLHVLPPCRPRVARSPW